MKTMLKPGLASASWTRFFLPFLFISIVQVSFSQKVFSTSGGTVSNDLIHVEYSLGQVFFENESNTRYLTCEGVLRSGVSEKKKNDYSQFNVFPNPSSGTFKVNFEHPTEIVKVTISNLQGVIIKEYYSGFEYFEFLLDDSHGIYFIGVTSRDGQSSKAITKL
jgi:hypothetical protein